MTKINYSINTYADLEREEIRIKKRLKKQEDAIKLKLKTLPEEVITTDLTRIVTGILNGGLFKNVSPIFKLIKGFFKSTKEEAHTETSETKSGLVEILTSVIKDRFLK